MNIHKITLLLLSGVIFSMIPSYAASEKVKMYQAEIWVDNWFALYINGKKIAEDSVPLTTERSFNSEKVKFSAALPFTVGLLAKDFTENASGLEYIGKPNQQIGDGGAIMQIREVSTQRVVAATDETWRVLVLARAPLNPECVKSSQPVSECMHQTWVTPKNWATNSFKDSTWKLAKVFTREEVGVKEGFYDFTWDQSAQLVWSSDLKLDNSLLIRKVIKTIK